MEVSGTSSCTGPHLSLELCGLLHMHNLAHYYFDLFIHILSIYLSLYLSIYQSISLLVYYFAFQDRVSLGSPDYLVTQSVDLGDLKLTAYHVLVIKAQATTPS